MKASFKRRVVPRPQRSTLGVMLIEVMVAILIFALGVLGIVGLQGTVVSQVSDARYRSDAALLASQLLSTMWLGDKTIATMQTKYNSPAGTGYTTWKNRVVATMPGVATDPPSVLVGVDGKVTIEIHWTPPGAASFNRYVVISHVFNTL